MSDDVIETRDLIAVILGLMPLGERRIVSMYYLEGYKCHEIGKRFGVGAGQISKLVREIIRECGYLVTQLDKKRKVFFKPLISRKSVLFNHTPYTKKKLLDRRQKTKEKQDMEEAWAYENFQEHWSCSIEKGHYVHPAIRRAYNRLMKDRLVGGDGV
tara:strand:+ start:23 stop:493 length:471 start_codon:yes stop_codon:yes gene_type:complete